jgi:hypothetical protein
MTKGREIRKRDQRDGKDQKDIRVQEERMMEQALLIFRD